MSPGWSQNIYSFGVLRRANLVGLMSALGPLNRSFHRAPFVGFTSISGRVNPWLLMSGSKTLRLEGLGAWGLNPHSIPT